MTKIDTKRPEPCHILPRLGNSLSAVATAIFSKCTLTSLVPFSNQPFVTPRFDVQRGTEFAMAQLSSPAEKTELALFLLSQLSSEPIPPASSPHDLIAPSKRLDASDVSVSPAGQSASTGGLPVVVVLHAAARMALSAARGVVMMPLPGVNELNEVVGLRVSGVIHQCL